MILRRPYAFLIKHFKFIHIIITFLLSYIFYKSVNILVFFNEYIGANQMTSVVGAETYLFNDFMFWSPLLVVLLSLVVSILMINKKKPLLYYFNLIIFYIFVFVFLLYTKGQVHILEKELIDIRTLKIIRDILVFGVSIEVLYIMISLVRGIGFDVKKFNFKEDLEELDINEEDREEIEVAIEFDVAEEKAKIRKTLRNFRYRIIENRSLLFVVGLCVIAVLVLLGIFSYLNREKIYKEGQFINPVNYTLKVNKTYLTQKNYLGNNVDNNKYFLLLDIHAKKNIATKLKLEKARMSIVVKGYSIYPTYLYSGSFKDIGFEYKDYELTDEIGSYLFVYEIPKQFIDDELYFKYYDVNDKSYRVKLNYIDLDALNGTKNVELNKDINLKDSLLEDSVLKISNIEFNDKFRINYNICLTNEECYKGYEMLYPDLSSNYDRTIIKINGNLKLNDSYYKKITLATFIDYFGNMYYEKDGKKYKADLNQIKPKKVTTNSVFFSVNKNILNAEKIELELKIRNYSYIYKIK